MAIPYLGIAKQHLADQLSSLATKGEGSQNMLGAYLAGALMLGLSGSSLARSARSVRWKPGVLQI